MVGEICVYSPSSSIAERDDLWQRIDALLASPALGAWDSDTGVTRSPVIAIAGLGLDMLVTQMQANDVVGASLRFAALHGHSFAVAGGVASYERYADELSLTDNSETYWQKRAEMLHHLVRGNMDESTQVRDAARGENEVFQDHASGLTITVDRLQATTGHTTFGSAQAESLSGTEHRDWQFGEGGADVLDGRGGDDWLEGGNGDDTLTGGKGRDQLVGGNGNDSYVFHAADFSEGELDVIEDKDGLGSIVVDGVTLNGGKRVNAHDDVWEERDADDERVALYVRQGDDLLIQTATGGRILIKYWTEGALGLGTRPRDDDPALPVIGGGAIDATPGDNIIYDHGFQFPDRTTRILEGRITQAVYFNQRVDERIFDLVGDLEWPPQLFRLGGWVYGGPGNSHIVGGGHANLFIDDVVYHYTIDGVFNLFVPNPGSDVLDGGGGNDLLLLGGGNDWAFGGDGNDRILAFNIGVLGRRMGAGWVEAIDCEDEDTFHGGAGDDDIFANGQNDILYGGSGNDRMGGGEDDDVLFGEDGDDILDGDVISLDSMLGAASEPQIELVNWEQWAAVGLSIVDVAMMEGRSGGKDVLDGGAGSDTLFGGGGDDVLLGGADDDFLYGDVSFSNTRDQIWLYSNYQAFDMGSRPGDPYPDIELDVDSQFRIWWHTNNHVEFAGNDYLSGGDGNDLAVGGAGNDVIDGDDGDDRLFGDGRTEDERSGVNNVLRVEMAEDAAEHGNDVLRGGAGQDQLTGAGGDDRLDGGDDDDAIWGDSDRLAIELHGDDVLEGGKGNDNLYGQGGNDELHGGDGDDQLVGGYLESEEDGDDILYGDAGKDTLHGMKGNDELHGGLDDDGLSGGEGHDRLFGGAGKDVLKGDNGNDDLSGGEGDDSLDGGSGNDRLDGGAGDDSLTGGAGNDTFVLSQGNDTVQDAEGRNRVSILGGLAAFSIGASTASFENSNGARMTMTLATFATIGEFELGGETLSSREFLRRMVPRTQSNTSINFAGGVTADQVNVRTEGNDLIITYSGGNSAWVSVGSLLSRGVPAVMESGAQPISALSEGAVSSSLSNVLVLVDWATHRGSMNYIQNLVVGGTTISLDGAFNAARQYEGTDSGDHLTGAHTDDVLRGRDGVDLLESFDGADTLDGGAGNDVLRGGAGNDRYLVSAGCGRDLILDISGNDALIFAAGITPANLEINETNEGLLVVINRDQHGEIQDSVLVANWLTHAETRLERFEFADGSSWSVSEIEARVSGNRAPRMNFEDSSHTFLYGQELLLAVPVAAISDPDASDSVNVSVTLDTGQPLPAWLRYDIQQQALVGQFSPESADPVTVRITATDNHGLTSIRHISLTADGQMRGTPFVDTLNGTSGADFMVGLDGNDQLRGQDGNDFLSGGLGDDVLNGGVGDDVLSGGAGADRLYGSAGTDSLSGGDGDDILNGEAGDDILNGGRGNDTLAGSAGSNRLVMQMGDGHDILTLFSGGYEQVEINRNFGDGGLQAIWLPNGSLRLSFADDTSLTIVDAYKMATGESGVASDPSLFLGVRFLDGTLLTGAQVFAMANQGNDDANLIWGTGLADALSLGAGNDQATTWGGADVVDAGAGNDSVDGGSGDDTLYGGDGDDKLYAGRTGTTASDTLSGGNGDDQLHGNLWRTKHNGGKGNDEIFGTWGTDEIYFNIGDGQDVVRYEHSARGGLDELHLGEGILPQDVILIRNGADMVVRFSGAEDSITFKQWFQSSAYTLGTIIFADGTRWYDWNRYIVTIPGTDGDDVLVGSGNIHGFGGNDELRGLLTNDVLRGGDGNDVLLGDGGDDVLHGGSGNDLLRGGEGGDTYIFNLGDGDDSVDSRHGNISPYGMEILRFGPGITREMLSSFRDGDDLKVRVSEYDCVTLAGFYSDFENISLTHVEIQGEENYLTLIDFVALVSGATESGDALTGTNQSDLLAGAGGNDAINGLAGSDRIWGGGGNDTLSGGDGNDLLYGQKGNDTLVGGEGSDTYWLEYESGQDVIHSLDTGLSGSEDLVKFINVDPATVIFSASGVDLKLSFQGRTDSLTVKDFFLMSGFSDVIASIAFSGYSSDGSVTVIQAEEIWATFSTPDSNSNVLRGTDAADRLDGLAGHDVLHGLSGDDVLVGSAGNDHLIGGDGGDLLYGDDVSAASTVSGADRIFGGAGNDTIYAGRGNDYADGGDGDDLLYGAHSIADSAVSGVDTLLGGTGNDHIYGNDGNDLLYGGEGDDVVMGGTGNDQIWGGIGNDSVKGGAGNDTFNFARGDGQDVLDAYDTATSRVDVLRFDASISWRDMRLERTGNNLVLRIVGTQDSVTVSNYFLNAASKISSVSFSDGTTWNQARIQSILSGGGIPAFHPDSDSEINFVGMHALDEAWERLRPDLLRSEWPNRTVEFPPSRPDEQNSERLAADYLRMVHAHSCAADGCLDELVFSGLNGVESSNFGLAVDIRPRVAYL